MKRGFSTAASKLYALESRTNACRVTGVRRSTTYSRPGKFDVHVARREGRWLVAGGRGSVRRINAGFSRSIPAIPAIVCGRSHLTKAATSCRDVNTDNLQRIDSVARVLLSTRKIATLALLSKVTTKQRGLCYKLCTRE